VTVMETADFKMVSGTGDWIQTFSGRQFWPLDPKPEHVHIVDVAHALSHLCRYAGHCTKFYSVAEHSLLLTWALRRDGYSDDVQRWALMHDAPEAYVVDMPRPIKRRMREYKAIENMVETAVAVRFGLPLVIPDIVHEYDSRICNDERRYMMNPCVVDWGDMGAPLDVRPFFFDSKSVKTHFLTEFDILFPSVKSTFC